ncbi:peroxisomal assembly protein [Pseudogymnoascus verrucosus]|uniref:Peroxisomal ATPase PEX6 n=1 Tax=Pseudogymnoascus verrucosus TaxID=342668 RepID=A0A1B8GGT8_9PEZI|nr:peroxisomal assembly protein [Pseudogymnoascus verrucosus]OBT95059.1 peroxisomal assembly protein [Pseudogymnoascus verrucosus]
MSAVIQHTPIANRRKRKRRRRQDKSAVFARLVLDEHVRGDVGIVSEDLYNELFPAQDQHDETNGDGPVGIPELAHIAISPKAPFNSVDEISWTVVPVRPSSALATNTIQFAPSSVALQGFAEELQRTTPSKLLSHSRSGIEIWALDVLPLTLDTVFVTLEAGLAKRLENGEGTFHGEHPLANGNHANGKSAVPEDRLSSAIREALSSLKVVHAGDFFPLPLAPHSITHVLPPPAKVTLCEPVAQGILSPNTRIIVTQTGHHTRTVRKASNMSLRRVLDQVTEVDEDTSNEQFFSAAEDRYKTDAAPEDDSMTETEAEDQDLDDTDNLSDDSMDEMISLQAPMLPSSNISGMATPLGPSRRTNGIATPGSVFSNYTATTARAGGQRGRLFKAQGLMSPLPEELLRPTPPADDDEEARIYVDVNSLTKIGCFSGDWVRLETASEPPEQGMGLWTLGSFGQAQDEDFIWRPVKVYSLPEGYSHRAVTKIPSSRGSKKMSFFDSQVSKPTSPTVYLSPILLANLDSTPYVRLSTLKQTQTVGKASLPKITNTSLPPVAREVTFAKIATPLATEKTLQTAAISGLKRHFTQRARVVKTGDIVGIPIDEALGRTLFQTSSGKEDAITDDMLVNPDQQGTSLTKSTGVIWFKVSHITHARREEVEDPEDEDIWGGVAAIDFSQTQMAAAGTEKSRLPPTKDSPWEHYFKLRAVSKSSSDALAPTMPEPQPQHITPLRRQLRELVAAATSARSIHLKLPPLAILLVSTQRNIGKATLASRACSDIGLHSFTIDAYDIVSEGGAGGDVKTEGFLKARADRALTCGAENTALVVRHIEALAAERMIAALKDVLADSRVIIATTTEVDKVPDGIRSLFTHELDMHAPDEGERESILHSIVDDRGVSLSTDVDLGGVAVKTAALVAGDLVDVVDRALVARHTRLESLATSAASAALPVSVRDVQLSGGPSRSLTSADFNHAVEHARQNFADAIGAPKIPNVTWDDVGGLAHVKDAVMETIQLPLERPELFAKGMKKRSGILFYGPPGTGKTLLAKAIATEFALNFFSVKGPELLNMYIGESEANVRRVFQRARDARPCVVFFDELDSVAPKRGNQGDSGGVMDRIVSQLLAELDGMSDGDDGGGGVFVIGATNRPDLLDAALLRPGRFDKMLYLGVSDTHDKQATIMEALTRKFTMSPTLSLPRIATRLPFTYTGADFYALCSDAMLKAVTRQASAVDAQVKAINSQRAPDDTITTAYFFDHYAKPADVAVVVTEEDFMAAQQELIPSVSAKELEHYTKVRAQFEAVPEANGGADGKKANGVVEKKLVNGRPRSSGKGKGKGKARMEEDTDEGVAVGGFGRAEEDEDLY